MVRAAAIRIAAAPNVIRIPPATASGLAVVMSAARDANSAPIIDAPVMSPRLRDRLSIPETTPRCSA